MQKNIMNIFTFKCLLAIFSCFIILFSSCSHNNEPIVYKEKTFSDHNWNFEQRIINFEAEIARSEAPYALILDLKVDPETFKLSQLETTVSVHTPAGSESHRISTFLFADIGTPKTTENGITTYSLKAYPEKYFSETGLYKFSILQKSNNYDMHGVHSIALRIMKKEEKE